MAYLELLEKQCDSCGKKASVELVNHRNVTFGFYCRECGDRKLKQMEAAEDKGKAWG